ncbi:hypothetical protein OC861_007048, partial [Tilletia horrida]
PIRTQMIALLSSQTYTTSSDRRLLKPTRPAKQPTIANTHPLPPSRLAIKSCFPPKTFAVQDQLASSTTVHLGLTRLRLKSPHTPIVSISLQLCTFTTSSMSASWNLIDPTTFLDELKIRRPRSKSMATSSMKSNGSSTVRWTDAILASSAIEWNGPDTPEKIVIPGKAPTSSAALATSKISTEDIQTSLVPS